jgi:hypothetical protein
MYYLKCHHICMPLIGNLDIIGIILFMDWAAGVSIRKFKRAWQPVVGISRSQ